MEENNDKVLNALKSRTIRELVSKANELLIKREDVITILPDNGFYVLFYYGYYEE